MLGFLGAEDVVAAVLQGKVEQSAMVGYYPKLSRLRARNASREANVVVQTQGTAIQAAGSGCATRAAGARDVAREDGRGDPRVKAGLA